MTATTPDPTIPPAPRATTVPRRVDQPPRDEGPATDPALASLTVRELIERLARAEEQLHLARIQGADQDPEARRSLVRRQHQIVRELRRRHVDDN